MKIKRKAYLTLIETLIALSLVSMLLTVVFGFFKEVVTLTQLTEKKQRETFGYRYLDMRLNHIFQRINNNKGVILKDFFYLENTAKSISHFPSLIFNFNNGPRADPDFSGFLLARLYVDNDKQLCLVTWPLSKEITSIEKMKKEILMTNVKEIKFKFYSPPAMKKSQNEQIPVHNGPKDEKVINNKWYDQKWILGWPKPAILKLILTLETDEKKDLDFAMSFVLPLKEQPIHYLRSEQ